MRALIQRVTEASVTIEGRCQCEIHRGLVVFLGVRLESTEQHAEWLADKILKLRLFDAPQTSATGDLSLSEIQGGLLIISQFTLHASTRKGTRPSYHRAAPPNVAEPLYEHFVATLRNTHTGAVQTGTFGADMQVQLINDGPVTLMMDALQKE